MRGRVVSTLRGVLGGAVGAFVGYVAFRWLWRHGFYGLMLPGALLGFGCGSLAQHPSALRGVFCALAAAAVGMYAEWTVSWFVPNDGFFYMAQHFLEKETVTIIMYVGGILLAFWLGKDAGFGGHRTRTAAGTEPRGGPPEPPAGT
jgi:hypothetical protein